ncbi:MAG: carbon dioxide concentrating mechanism protein CcmL [Planctomycetales bacterium]|nr:carbon dioxide concentrating mechanism protein CcmL [Planctomycetales bacterium]
MQVFQVIGNITLCKCHESFHGARLLATEPLGTSLLTGQASTDPDLVVVWDELGAGDASRIAVSDGAEAAQPFRPALKAVDAYCSAILDDIIIDPITVAKLRLNSRG